MSRDDPPYDLREFREPPSGLLERIDRATPTVDIPDWFHAAELPDVDVERDPTGGDGASVRARLDYREGSSDVYVGIPAEPGRLDTDDLDRTRGVFATTPTDVTGANYLRDHGVPVYAPGPDQGEGWETFHDAVGDATTVAPYDRFIFGQFPGKTSVDEETGQVFVDVYGSAPVVGVVTDDGSLDHEVVAHPPGAATDRAAEVCREMTGLALGEGIEVGDGGLVDRIGVGGHTEAGEVKRGGESPADR